MRTSLPFFGLVVCASLTIGCIFALPAREIPIDCEGALRHQDYDTYCKPGSSPAALPSAVTNLVAEPTSTTSIKLTWTAGIGQTSYRIDFGNSATPDMLTTVGSEDGQATSTIVTGLQPSTSYVLSVTAINGNGASAATTIVASTPADLPMAPGATSMYPAYYPNTSSGSYLCLPKANDSASDVDYKTLSAAQPLNQQKIPSACSNVIPTTDVVLYLGGNFSGSEDINEFANPDASGTVVTMPNAVANRWYAPAATSHLVKTVISQGTVFWVMTWHAATKTITLAQAPNGMNGGQPIKGSGVIR